jgi:hypothetical protein
MMRPRAAAPPLVSLAALAAAWSVALPWWTATWRELPALTGLPAAASPTDVDRLLSSAALVAAGPLLLWLTAITVTAWLGLLPGALGRLSRRCASAITPVALRAVVRGALGVTLSGTAVAAGLPAHAVAEPDLPAVGRPVVALTEPAPDGSPGIPASPQPAPGSAQPPASGPPAPAAASPTRPETVPTPAATPPGPTPSPVAGPAPAAGATSPVAGSPANPPGPPSATPRPAVEAAARPAGPAIVVVQRGDCLWDIAARALGDGASDADVAAAWPRWYAANRDVVGPDPDLLHPGAVLRPPAGG